jgi:hypothetical protein
MRQTLRRQFREAYYPLAWVFQRTGTALILGDPAIVAVWQTIRSALDRR